MEIHWKPRFLLARYQLDAHNTSKVLWDFQECQVAQQISRNIKINNNFKKNESWMSWKSFSTANHLHFDQLRYLTYFQPAYIEKYQSWVVEGAAMHYSCNTM